MLWTLMIACSGTPTPEVAPEPVQSVARKPGPTEASKVSVKGDVVGIQSGVQHPPIPADSPAWRHDPGGFVPDPRFYGEHDWDGVRVRLAGHIGVIERDRARWLAGKGQLQRASEIYTRLAADVESMSSRMSGPSQRIPSLIVDAARRDAARLRALAAGKRGGAATPSALTAQKLPDISDFKDFDDRHELRVELWSLYLEAADPIHPDTAWGYFDKPAFSRLLALRGDIAAGKCTEWVCPTDAEAPLFTVEGIGGMPTGDTLIDVGGEPGPKAIGRLEKLSLDEPTHRQWVEDTAYVLNARLQERPGAVLSVLKSRVDQLDSFKHGSRYYNIKQLRNEGVRVLAARGHYDIARQVLAMNFPLHHQDWECPNREGILLAIDARLAGLDGVANTDALMLKARQVTDAFLAKVDSADAH